MHQTTRDIVGLQRLVRWPNLLIIFFTQYLVRIFLVGPSAQWLSHLTDLRFFTYLVSVSCVVAGGYIINDYYDIKIDTVNDPQKVVIGQRLRRRKALAAHLLFTLSGFFISLLLNWKLAAINLFAIFWLWLYSNQLKRMPFVGNFTVASLTALVVFVVGIYFKSTNYLVYIFGFFAFYISLIREIIKDMETLRGDMHFGLKTLPVVWGIRKTKTVLYTILLAFIITTVPLLLLIGNPTLDIYFLCMLLPTAYFIFKLYWADTRKEYQRLRYFCNLVMISGIGIITLL
ncbi:geranylgeranylglycerol-phosphate geranylgeranyltransferase [Rapidithrix thailandica]|uniref:Geranylgeranylglycerol-phosphate geranylgeranyltransferase n=1 Tax=Rapidithrix thailandica TaxID=413964 RepID=A0AAW9SC46_9BACT